MRNVHAKFFLSTHNNIILCSMWTSASGISTEYIGIQILGIEYFQINFIF